MDKNSEPIKLDELISIKYLPASTPMIVELERLTSQLAAETHHLGLLIHDRSSDTWFASESEEPNLQNLNWSGDLLEQVITDSRQMTGVFKSLAADRTYTQEDGSSVKYFIFQGGNSQYNVVMLLQALPLVVSFEWFETLLHKQGCPLVAFVRNGQVIYPAKFDLSTVFGNSQRTHAEQAWESMINKSVDTQSSGKPDFAFPRPGFLYYTVLIPLAGGVSGMYYLPSEGTRLLNLPQQLGALQNFFNALMASIGTTPPFFVQSTSMAIERLFSSPDNLSVLNQSESQ